MARKATIFWQDKPAGLLSEQDEGYVFGYFKSFLEDSSAKAISLIMPLREKPYVSKTMFPFFDGLIPEGWLLDIAIETWKLDSRDRMGLLLTCCKDCIGAVSVVPEKEETND